MTMTYEISGENSIILTRILQYEQPIIKGGENWLDCMLEIKVGGFSAKLSASFTNNDLIRFQEEINSMIKNMSGIASFRCDEEWLELDLEMEKTGKVIVTGTVKEIEKTEVVMRFRFESDQTYISRSLSELKLITANYSQ